MVPLNAVCYQEMRKRWWTAFWRRNGPVSVLTGSMMWYRIVDWWEMEENAEKYIGVSMKQAIHVPGIYTLIFQFPILCGTRCLVTWCIGNWELGSRYIGDWKIRVYTEYGQLGDSIYIFHRLRAPNESIEETFHLQLSFRWRCTFGGSPTDNSSGCSVSSELFHLKMISFSQWQTFDFFGALHI